MSAFHCDNRSSRVHSGPGVCDGRSRSSCQRLHGSRAGVAISGNRDAQVRDSHEDRSGPREGQGRHEKGEHPGPTFVAVAQGEGTLYHGMSGCPSVKYATGAGFMQPSTEVHNMRNEGSTPLVLWAFYALPPGTTNAAIRIDQPQPAECPNIP